jgi:hypothetical protein
MNAKAERMRLLGRQEEEGEIPDMYINYTLSKCVTAKMLEKDKACEKRETDLKFDTKKHYLDLFRLSVPLRKPTQ